MSSTKELNVNDLPDPKELLSVQDLPSPDELEASQKEAPGQIEAFLRGGAQGLSFGFADEATAGLESLLSNKTYDKALEESRANYKASEEEHPYTTMAGNITGGIGGGAALSAAAAPLAGAVGLGKLVGGGAEALTTLDKLKRAASLGAGYGAITSAGTSENSITEKPLALAGDVLTGAAVGGAGGAVLSGLGSTVGKGLDKLKKLDMVKNSLRTFGLGTEGKSVLMKETIKPLEIEGAVAAEKVADLFQENLNHLKSARAAMIGKAEANGATVDATKLINDAKIEIEKLRLHKVNANDKETLLSVFNTLDPKADTGRLSPSAVEQLKEDFSLYTTRGDHALKGKEAREIAYKLTKALDEQVMNKVDKATSDLALSGMGDIGTKVSNFLSRTQEQGTSPIKTLNNGINKLLTARDMLGQDGIGEAEQLLDSGKLMAAFNRTATEGTGGVNARVRLNQVKEVLGEIAPDITGPAFKNAERIGEDLHVLNIAGGHTGGGIGKLIGAGNLVTAGGSNVAGSLYSSTKVLSTPVSKSFKAIANYAGRNGDTGLSTALGKISETVDENRRKAMVNTLMQTPYYRHKIESIKKTLGLGEDDDGSKN